MNLILIIMGLCMSVSKLLSVVIPTHNGWKYSRSAIDSILAFDESDFELIVHDTSDGDELERYAAQIDDARLIYRKCSDALSMTENHNKAMALSRGRYVCLIGDDDTILRDLFCAARWADKNGVDVISPEVVANYAWPDFRSKYFGKGHAGRLYIKKNFGDWSVRCSKKALDKALKLGGQGTDNMPKIYHGLVRKSVLDSIAECGGSFFYGTAPDVSGSIGLALFTKKFVLLNYPLTLPGASGGSNTGRSAEKKHKGELSSDLHTKRFKGLVWPKFIPQFSSVENVWAQSTYEVLSHLEPGALKKHNCLRVYALNFIKHPDQFRKVLVAYREYSKNSESRVVLFKLWYWLFSEAFRSGLKLGLRALTPTAAGKRNFVDSIPDIYSAQEAFETYKNNTRELKLEEVLSQIKY